MPNNDTLKYDRATIGGAVTFTNVGSSLSNQYFGRTQVVSDTNGASFVMSTALVAATSIIQVTFQSGAGGVASNWAPSGRYDVATISPGGFFKVANVSSSTAVGSLPIAMWVLYNPGA